MFSKACEYAIRAAIFIGQQSKLGKRVSLKSIAKAIDSPEAFTAKILQALSKHELIISTKGPTGGYELLNTPKHKISVLQIVEAIDGDKLFNKCALGLKECSADKPCHLHNQFVIIRDELELLLKSTTVQSLSEDLEEKSYFLKR